MLLFLQALLAFLIFMLGAALFSFMNVVAWRLPQGLGVIKGRSACPACGAALTARDLIPVFSWVFLRGKCRHCGAPIAVRYLLAELAGGVCALGCAWRFGAAYTPAEGLFGMRWMALLALAACGLLGAIALIDAKTRIIPDGLNLAVGVCGLLAIFAAPEISLPARAIGALCVSVPMLLLCLVIPGGFGGGDIKLMFAAGVLLGWQSTLVAMFLAVLGGGAWGIYLLAAKKADRKAHFAFGPFLCAGIALALFFGDALLHWYLQWF